MKRGEGVVICLDFGMDWCLVVVGVVKGKYENVVGIESGGVLIYKEWINR